MGATGLSRQTSCVAAVRAVGATIPLVAGTIVLPLGASGQREATQPIYY
jgi:hypothetical protein